MEETNSLARSRRMGEMPEGKLLLSMAVPMMLSMLVQALYNIVDSVYVAKVSEDCLSHRSCHRHGRRRFDDALPRSRQPGQ